MLDVDVDVDVSVYKFLYGILSRKNFDNYSIWLIAINEVRVP